jgi:hypothetical protein
MRLLPAFAVVHLRRSPFCSVFSNYDAFFADMIELSEDDCLAISRAPLEIGHLRKPLQKAIEADEADSQKTQAFSDESNLTEADDEPGE